jgi:hypothetical protein
MQANGQPAVAWYRWDPERDAYRPAALEMLGLDGVHIREITAYVSLQLFPRFGLPAELPRATQRPGRPRNTARHPAGGVVGLAGREPNED